MKMGTIVSPSPYDAALRHALQSAKLRHPTTLHYTSRAAFGFGRVVRLPFDDGPLDHFRDRRDGLEQTIQAGVIGLMLAGC
jgi:hypothetical protein